MAANAAIYPKKDLEAASAALLKCLSSRVWITNYASCSHCHPNRSNRLLSFPISQSQSEAASLLSDPARLGAVYGTEMQGRLRWMQQGQSGTSMCMWPPFKYVMSSRKNYLLTNFDQLITHLLNRYFAYYQRTSANASFIKELLTFDM